MSRGLFAGGVFSSSPIDNIEYITIETTGNSTDSGDLQATIRDLGSCSNGTSDRGIFAGGYVADRTTLINYLTISTTGNASDFGDLSFARDFVNGLSNLINNRGVFGGGKISSTTICNIIDYITINTTGNATDFGDLTIVKQETGGVSNGIYQRGVFIGGITTGPAYINVIDYITISNTSNATDFGDAAGNDAGEGTSNFSKQRAILASGADTQLSYITIDTLGNATNFGNFSSNRSNLSTTSNGVTDRAVFGGGSGPVNIIDYITISTTGNATDFGDLVFVRYALSATSNADGGTAALNKWMNILETNIPKMLGVDKATTQLSKLMGLTLTDYVSITIGDRGVFFGGQVSNGTYTNVMEYITISTTGNSQDFGDISSVSLLAMAVSNGTNGRGVFQLSYNGTAYINTLEYITILTTGNSTDFGDRTVSNSGRGASFSSRTNERGVFCGGYTNTWINVWDYITINSAGNATDAGDIFQTTSHAAGCSNAENNRGIVFGGYKATWTLHNVIQYLTFNSTGNGSDFGDLSAARSYMAGISNGVNDRGVSAGGYQGARINTLEYITISTTGNATDLGDMISSVRYSPAGFGNDTGERGIHAGGAYENGTSIYNIIDYFTINTSANGYDFGDLLATKNHFGGTSNG